MSDTTSKKSDGLKKTWVWVEKHPTATAAGVFVLGAIIIFYYSRRAAPAQAAAQPQAQDNTAAYLQAEAQSNSTQAALSAELAQVQAAANAQTAQVNGSVSVAQYNDQAAVDEATIAANSANTIASLQAALGTTQSNNTTSTNNLNITTTGQVDLANINAQTTQQQNADATQVALGQQTTGVLSQLLNGIFSQNANVYTGNLNVNANQSTNSRIAQEIPQINSLPSTTLFTQQQVQNLLQG
jgi:hypothetical protein